MQVKKTFQCITNKYDDACEHLNMSLDILW